MLKLLICLPLAAILMSAAFVCTAAPVQDLSDPAFRAQFVKKHPGIKAKNIKPTPVHGLYQVSQDGVVGYVTADGRYLLDGDLIDLDKNDNLSAQARRQYRVEQLATVNESDMLIYAPKKTKFTLTVFTDVDCHYCRVLHSHIQQFLNAGIRVRYLFFPLAGPGSAAFKKAEAVWCSKDRKAALTRAMAGKSVGAKTDCKKPVDAEFKLAWDSLNLRGTPTLITQDGRILELTQPISKVIKQITSGA